MDPKINSGPVEKVFDQWRNGLTVCGLKPRRARDLYKGALWDSYMDTWGIINGRVDDAKLWILSAGYGLINPEEKIIPYDITFQESKDGVPSILAKIDYPQKAGAKREVLQSWWTLLNKAKKQNPLSLEALMAQSGSSDHFLFVLSKDYLDAVFVDLKTAIHAAKRSENIAIISNSKGDPVARLLRPHWLYADNRFVNLPRTNSTVVNARISHELLWHMFQEEKGLSWWSLDNFNDFLQRKSSGLPKPQKIVRQPATNSEVESYINEALKIQEISFTKLHRSYRDSGRACEYTRFRKIYRKVVDDLKANVLAKRPHFPVVYKKRKAKMLFFLPDWDDRVDPFFDFVNDIPTPNRNPYEFDAYHYELYGTLNCDGILVSKSVLETNPQKKALVQKNGIHRYLRLPKEAPVIGDCGAFNYIMEENPPYESYEILTYYEDFGFDYGVSIDHLIVPGILKRHRYFKREVDKWVGIDEEIFMNLENDPNTVVKSRRSEHIQWKLFNEQNIIADEIYIDEDERNRRYELTTKNAKDFIEGHGNGNFSFCPIGAAQGWDAQSYTDAVKNYQQMGYTYIALGGLVRSTTDEILNILEKVNSVRKKDTKLHIFGVARLDAIPSFMEFGVSSVDSAGMLRQAWLSSSSNYHSPTEDHYAAIRIPIMEKSPQAKSAIRSGVISENKLRNLEASCLSILRRYDDGGDEVSLEEALHNILLYDEIVGRDGSMREKYIRTLSDRPWRQCPCKLCQETGIDIMIFRRNNRNRRRGFHNTWVFFDKFRSLTALNQNFETLTD